MFKWKKLGKIFEPSDHVTPDWMQEFAQAPAVIIFDDFVRVYFSCRPTPDDYGQYTSYSAFLDLDKQNLFNIIRIAQKPIIPLGSLGNFDEFGIYPVSVINDDGRLKAFYAGWTRCESVPFNVNIGAAISNDNGMTFKKIGEGPILSYTPDEPFILSGPKIRKFNGVYYLFYIAGNKWVTHNNRPEPVYKIRMATSDDGMNWTKINCDLIESRIDLDEAQASPDVIFFNGKYRMFFCYRYGTDYRNKSRGYRIGYAESENLIDWTRNDDKVGIDVSQNGWDSEMISYPHLFTLNDTVFMMYLGNGVGKTGFGLASLENKDEIDELD